MSRATLAGSLAAQEEKLLNCVHCGFCLPACPTYVRLGNEADSPRGRLYLMRAVVEGRLDSAAPAFQTHIDRCLGCRACEPVCPSGVEYGSLLELARDEAAAARKPRILDRVLLAAMAHPILRRPLLRLSRLLAFSRLPFLGAKILPSRFGLGKIRLGLAMLASSGRAPLPRGGEGRSGSLGGVGSSSPESGPPWESGDGDPFPRIPVPANLPHDSAGEAGEDPGGVVAAGPGPEPTPVALLEGCVQSGLFGRVNEATVRVLEVNGFRVVPVGGQGCCGALHAHGGDLRGARGLARENIAAFENMGVEAIAVNAAGCGAAMKEYGELLAGDPGFRERAERLSAMVRDVSELLAERGPVRGGSLALRATYDAPCHLIHAQGVAAPPLAILRAIPELEVVPLRGADECCGGAGVYGITHAGLGGWIGRDKVEAIRETGAEVVATGNPGCMMQIGAGLIMRGLAVTVHHPVELLDESYRRAGLYRSPATI